MAYTTIDDPTIYFNTVLYTGNASTQSITGVGFSPSFVWIKSRNDTNEHYLFDIIRGVHEPLIASANTAETTDTNTVTSFDSDGFSIGNNTGINGSSDTECSWNWKAGTSFTNDASATGVGTIDSTGSVSSDSGFSIISYSGTGSVGTVAHGLNAVPKMILFKNRTTASNWLVYHEGIGNTHNLYLDANNAKGDRSDTFNDTSPTSSVFTVGTADLNTSGNSIIAYCFAEKKGFSKIGTHVGNGNADGTFVFCGFRPAFVISKRYNGSGNWTVHDNKRNSYNGQYNTLFPNLYNVEISSSARSMDFFSNGFKFAGTDEGNVSGEEYIHIVFASSPFTNSSGVPNNAR